MAVRQRELSIREENDYFLLNRGIVQQEVAAVPISFQVAPESGGAHNAGTGLQGGTLDQYYHLTSAEHGTLVDGGDAQLLHTHEFYQRYAFYVSS